MLRPATPRSRWVVGLAIGVLPWVLLGLVRGLFRIGFGQPADPGLVLGRSLAMAAFWIPVAPLLYRLGQRTRSPTRVLLAPEAFLAVAIEPVWAGMVVRPDVFLDGVSFGTWVIDRLDLNLFTAVAVVGIGLIRRHAADRLALAAAERGRAAALRQAEFDLLNSQIQPHFLFNALNTLAELVHRDAALAGKFLGNLDRLFERSVAADGRPETSVADELAWLRAYLAVQEQRFGPRLAVEIAAPDEVLALALPTLVLQPLAENAVRHGVETVAGPARIRVVAERAGRRLRVTITNTVGAGGSGAPGLGIENARRRLAHGYGDDGSLTFERGAALAVVVLEVPARPPAAPTAAVPDEIAAIPSGRRLSNRTGLLLAVLGWAVVLTLWQLAVRTSASLTGAPAWGTSLMVAEAVAYLLVTVGAVVLIGVLHRRGIGPATLWIMGTVVAAGLAAGAAVAIVDTTDPSGNAGWLMANWAEQRFAILGAILVGAHSWWQYRTRADAAAATDALREAAERTRFSQLRWRVQPGLVRDVLRQAGRLAPTDPDGAERVTLGLSRLLRGMLTDPDRNWAPLADEVERASNLAALHQALDPEAVPFQLGLTDNPDQAVPRGALTELIGTLAASRRGARRHLANVTVRWSTSERAFHFIPAAPTDAAETIAALTKAITGTGLGRLTREADGVGWNLAAVSIHEPTDDRALELEAA